MKEERGERGEGERGGPWGGERVKKRESELKRNDERESEKDTLRK